MDIIGLFRQVARARAYELAVEDLWTRGLISGEMHLGTGEEAVAAGVVTQLREGDALAVTHRGSPALVVRGLSLVEMLRELLGREDGLCRGRGGHMHLMSREHLAAASGIVGASLPTAAGFALAAKHLRRGSVAVAFTGDGAMNQGMALETLNLAATWTLPLVVVCIDNGWAITTRSGAATSGELAARAKAFGWRTLEVDGCDVEAVHRQADVLLAAARGGKGPGFLLASCPRMDGHLLGDLLVRMARTPLGEESRKTLGMVAAGATSSAGAGLMTRAQGLLAMMGTAARAAVEPERGGRMDPLVLARRAAERAGGDAARLEEEARQEVARAVEVAQAGEVAHG